MADAEDPRLVLALSSTQAALAQQEATLDNLRARSTTLLTAAAVSASFLGAATYGKGHLSDAATGAAAVAVVAFVAVLGSVVFIGLPREWHFRVNGRKIISRYIEPTEGGPLPIDRVRRDLVLFLEEDYVANKEKLRPLWLAMQLASGALAVEVTAWVVGLALS